MYVMAKRYTVASVRERLADALDEAEKGIPVIIERRGVRYRLTMESSTPRRTGKRRPRGEWTWEGTPDGLIVAGRPRA